MPPVLQADYVVLYHLKAKIQVNLGQWVNNAKMHYSNSQPMGISGLLNTGF